MSYTSQTVKWLGYIAFGLGILAFLEEHIFKFSSYSHSYNPGYGLAVCALIFRGMISLIISECLQAVEKRLEKIENNKPEH